MYWFRCQLFFQALNYHILNFFIYYRLSCEKIAEKSHLKNYYWENYKSISTVERKFASTGICLRMLPSIKHKKRQEHWQTGKCAFLYPGEIYKVAKISNNNKENIKWGIRSEVMPWLTLKIKKLIVWIPWWKSVKINISFIYSLWILFWNIIVSIKISLNESLNL